MEVIRRYPSTVEMFENYFQEALKPIGCTNEKDLEGLKKNIFILYCELCLLGTIGKENIVGKALKTMTDLIAASEVKKCSKNQM